MAQAHLATALELCSDTAAQLHHGAATANMEPHCHANTVGNEDALTGSQMLEASDKDLFLTAENKEIEGLGKEDAFKTVR